MQDNQNPVAVEDVPVVAWARKHGAHASYRRVTDCKLFNDDLPLVRKADHDARIARLIAHIDAQADLLKAAELDSRRIDWLADKDNNIGNVELPQACVMANLHSLRGAIDSAMAMSTAIASEAKT
jgi:hypothetical protein